MTASAPDRSRDEAAICEAMGVHPHALAEYSAQRFLDEVASVPTRASYQNLGAAKRYFRDLAHQHSDAAAECFARIALKQALTRSWAERTSVLPESLQRVYEGHTGRITANLTEAPPGHYYPYKDNFLKDFGIARRQLLPAGAPVLDLDDYLHRRPLRTGPVGQRLRFLNLWRRQPFGRGPYYQVHTHTDSLAEFTEEGWRRSYQRMAELLALNPHVKGFYRASWFCDPAVATISPRLAYLTQLPTANGAELFYLGPDLSGNALQTSPTRRRLYEQGRYIPLTYLLVWHRHDLISWAIY